MLPISFRKSIKVFSKMSRFIKFTSTLINTRYIRKISLDNEMYKLHYHDGFFGVYILTLGMIDTCSKEITICKTNDPDDYKIMTEWIEKQDNN